MDLRTRAVAQTAFLHLKDAEDQLMYADEARTQAVGITMYGPGSKPYQKAQSARTNKAVQRLKAKGKTDLTAEEAREETAQFLAAVTADFQYIERDDLQGEALYLATYRDVEIGFIAEQAQAFVNDWANFSKGSRTS